MCPPKGLNFSPISLLSRKNNLLVEDRFDIMQENTMNTHKSSFHEKIRHRVNSEEIEASYSTIKNTNKYRNMSINEDKSKIKAKQFRPMEVFSIMLFIIVCMISYFGYPHSSATKIHFVWYFGWLTAFSTGFGALPFLFFKNLSRKFLGVSNSLAAGMMMSATVGLLVEGYSHENTSQYERQLYEESTRDGLNQAMGIPSNKIPEISEINTITGVPLIDGLFNIICSSVTIGMIVGMLFIHITREFLEKYELTHLIEDETDEIMSNPQEFDDKTLKRTNSMIPRAFSPKRMCLILLVMTIHSFSEGVGIGVSFGTHDHGALGLFITATLALHNIPEGLAVCLTLAHKGIGFVNLFLISVLTSLPQPLMAVPSYWFVEEFMVFLPYGLGFAGGAMCFVCIFELIPEALEDLPKSKVICIATISFVMSFIFQIFVKSSIG